MVTVDGGGCGGEPTNTDLILQFIDLEWYKRTLTKQVAQSRKKEKYLSH